MPKPICVLCNTNESLLWRTIENGQICNQCHTQENASSKDPKPSVSSLKTEKEDKNEEQDDIEMKSEKIEGETTPAKATGRGVRKSTRATRYKAKTQNSTSQKTPSLRGRGRRSIFKRQPLKAPTSTPTIVTSDSIFYKGSYMQVGDIVSMVDVDGGLYYAQIRGFMTDQYCEKSATITWLLPTKASPPPEDGFDPSTYILGPEEDLARSLDAMEFVMHAPSDYYKASITPYPMTDVEINNHTGFIWTTLDPVI